MYENNNNLKQKPLPIYHYLSLNVRMKQTGDIN